MIGFDERRKVVEALGTIKELCCKYEENCRLCPLSNPNDPCECVLNKVSPCYIEIAEPEDVMWKATR